MKFRYNIFNFITAIMFVLAFLSIMISYATVYMYYPAIIFFETGFVMLTIRLMKNYLTKKDDLEQKEEVIVMELASGENGDEYVMRQDELNKKGKRKKRSVQFDRLMPVIFSMLASILFMYLLISTIVTKI